MTQASRSSPGSPGPVGSGVSTLSPDLARRRRGAAPVLALLALALLWPAVAAAQQDTAWRSLDTLRLARPTHAAVQPPDFLFQEPRTSLNLRVGMLFPRAGNGVFQQSMQELTLSKRNLDGLTGAVDLGFRILPRLDALLGVAVSHAGKDAAIRASQCGGDASTTCVDNNNVPLQQHTTFTQVPLTAGLKAYPLPRGQQIGHFVWVPARVTPYVGAAAGMVYYKYGRSGDFIGPSPDFSVFSDNLQTSGWTPIGQVLGGVDVRLGRRTAIKAEARYSWASGGLGQNFVGFNDGLDLAGLQTTLGLSWRY